MEMGVFAEWEDMEVYSVDFTNIDSVLNSFIRRDNSAGAHRSYHCF